MVYDISIEEHIYRLGSTIRSISGLWCMIFLLRSIFTGWGAPLGEYIWSVVYDISIEEHIYRLRSIIRNISGLWCKVLLLRSIFTGWGAPLEVYLVCGVRYCY